MGRRIEVVETLRSSTIQEANSLFDSVLNELWKQSSSWQRKPIRLLAAPVSGQIDPQIEPYASLPHINGEAIEPGTCRLLAYRLAREDAVKSGKFHFKPGAILYSKIRPYLRKAVELPFEGICSADIYAFDSVSAEVDRRFFMYSLIAPPFTGYANSLSGRTRMPKLNQNQLLAFELSYPQPVEQRRIVAYLDALQLKVATLRKTQYQSAAEINALMPSVLSKAFGGEI